MRFDLKLFVLVGILAGFRDVLGADDNEDDGFIVEKLTDEQKKEVDVAMKERRVIRAVYTTKLGGDVFIIDEGFKNQLSSIVVWDGKKGVTVQDFKAMNTVGWPRIAYNMQSNVKYTVYFIFKQGSVNSTKGMFRGCMSLISADFTNFNTENVINMSYMFSGCCDLKELDLSKFDTQNVTSMCSMFSKCSSLTELNLSSFETKKVACMSLMFYNCSALTKLDLSKFDTKNVTDMISMFSKCSSLTTLNLSNFNTSNVTNMSYVFRGCTSLTKLDLSNFDTKKVENMSWMFFDCSALKNLDLGNFDFHNVVKIDDIFTGCKFDNLCMPNTRKRCWCCCCRYVYLKGKVFVRLNQNNVEFEVVHDDPVSNIAPNLV